MTGMADALRNLAPFRCFNGHLTGEPVEPFMSSAAGEQWKRGSVARIFAGALSERGTAGVIGGGRLPDTGCMDLAEAFGLALFEADYVVRSYGTPIAWHLGPEVAGVTEPHGEWVVTYQIHSRTTSKHTGAVRAALEVVQTDQEVTHGA